MRLQSFVRSDIRTASFFATVAFVLVTVGCGRAPLRSPEAALTELQNLATLRCEFNIVSFVNHTDLGGTDKVLRKLTGSVLLSYNLKKANIRREGDTIVVSLPEMEPLSPKIEYGEKYGEHRSFYTSETTFNHYLDEADKEAQEKLKENARDPQLVDIAKNQCRVLIQEFYRTNFGLDAVVE